MIILQVNLILDGLEIRHDDVVAILAQAQGRGAHLETQTMRPIMKSSKSWVNVSAIWSRKSKNLYAIRAIPLLQGKSTTLPGPFLVNPKQSSTTFPSTNPRVNSPPRRQWSSRSYPRQLCPITWDITPWLLPQPSIIPPTRDHPIIMLSNMHSLLGPLNQVFSLLLTGRRVPW